MPYRVELLREASGFRLRLFEAGRKDGARGSPSYDIEALFYMVRNLALLRDQAGGCGQGRVRG